MADPLVSVILPAHDEARYIGACLAALLAAEPGGYGAEVIVVANACTDDTVAVAQGFVQAATARGWGFRVINTDAPGKLNALNLGEAAATGTILVYLDADVSVSPPLLGQIADLLDTDAPRYASGQPQVAQARSGITRAFARFWQRLPFVTQGVPGFGVFAVNAAGRARWGDFPPIISDDTFVRLHFAPEERIGVPASYNWPMVEGLHNLVKVRRRQEQGVQQIAERFPELLQNDDGRRLDARTLLALSLRDPAGCAAYMLVRLLVRTPFAKEQGWARGR